MYEERIAAMWDTVARSLADKVWTYTRKRKFIPMNFLEVALVKAFADKSIKPDEELARYVARAARDARRRR